MQGEHQEEFQCLICNELILKPAILPCKHQFCCYCLRSIKHKHEQNMIVCPLCRRVTEWAPLNKQKQFQVIKGILKRPKVRVFWGKGFTINDYDENLTDCRGFFYILMDDNLIGDIIWGEGSEHSSYNDEVGRVYGKVKILQNGNIQYMEKYGAKYSNGPTEDWSGVYKNQGKGKLVLNQGKYLWHWNGRESSGKIIMELTELHQQDSLQNYRVSSVRQLDERNELQKGQEIICPKCNQLKLNPIILPCGHKLCGFCVKLVQNIESKIANLCPLCKKAINRASIDKNHQKIIIKQLLKKKQCRVFWGKASTINDYDENYTTSQEFFFILMNQQLKADIVWGGGSQHNTYLGEVGRVSGKINLLEKGQFELSKDYGAVYTNTPRQTWSGTFRSKGNNHFVLEKGKYIWYGWGRESSGTLKIELKQITSKEDLNQL